MAGTRSLSDDEQRQMLDALERLRDRVLFLAGLYTGFRISELLRLTIGDVWKRGQPVLALTIARRNLKGGAGQLARRVTSRSVPMHPALRAAIATYIAQRFAGEPVLDEPLFLSRQNGRPLSYVQAWRVIKTAAAATGAPDSVATHSMRKTFVRTIYNNSGHDIVLTKEAVGHRSIATTSAYLSASAPSVSAAILGIQGPNLKPMQDVQEQTRHVAPALTG